MKTQTLILLLLMIGLFSSCKEGDKTQKEFTSNVIDIAAKQYEVLYDSIQAKKGEKFYIPRAIKDGNIKYAQAYDWTSGFYAGSLWYLFKLTKDDKWKDRAMDYTTRLDSVQYYTGNHDIGFMMEASFGNAMKLYPSAQYDSVIVQSAKSLMTRFRPKAGIIQSWEPIVHFKEGMWECPVIIDNMMNLELLFHATKITGDSIYRNTAITHADNTIKNHFRSDYSSYHVVDYDVETGKVFKRTTHQGLSDESAWSRGQAWGLYGYTAMYRETKDKKYLNQAIKIADFIENHPNMPEDLVPYWDFDAEVTPTTKRDASAAAIIASALLELQEYVSKEDADRYMNWAKQTLKSLESPAYLATDGTNKGFILKHSVGTLLYGVEVDSPLNYADYYFLEALDRLRMLEGNI
ncbi:glycoside hydrolase family 88 protein [Mariniflexile ostreae]|uniref:Glycoside hydrolase family 88 protein n=1 Tax=Mariniflexile ostreae TaxID=1520892 RepID=A0ABV5FBX7_9FLAO